MKNYLLLLFSFVFSTIYAQNELEEKVLGEYKYFAAYTLDYEEWDTLKNYSDFGIKYYNDYDLHNLVISITKEENLLGEHQYFVSLHQDKNLIHKHYISRIDYRLGFDEAYDIQSGRIVITIFMDEDATVMYYDYNMSESNFESVYVFRNE